MLEFLTNLKVFGIEIYEVLIWFLIYGVIGWIFESGLRSAADKKFVNRGFLYGPFIPIYAFGITGFVFLLNPLYTLEPLEVTFIGLPQGHQTITIEYKYYLIMIGGMIISSILEYVVSFSMEKLFNQRWWDYTPYKYNTKGRVCFSITFCWGALSVAAVHFIHPLIGKNITDWLPKKVGFIIILVGYSILFIDIILSNISATKKKKQMQAEAEKSGEADAEKEGV
ncbi:MAG: putative ABC transporter permease [Clostridia bacterium]|nr:putative ABC transporter permease [Clostridia bacterium]